MKKTIPVAGLRKTDIKRWCEVNGYKLLTKRQYTHILNYMEEDKEMHAKYVKSKKIAQIRLAKGMKV